MPRWRWITVVALWAAALIIWPLVAVIAYASGHPTFTPEGWTAASGAAEGFLLASYARVVISYGVLR
jgi:uncharacterized membrane protein